MNRKRNRRNTGAIYVETLITLPIVIYFGLITWQLIDLAIAGYIVKHAAICAARAAAVIGPDSTRFYGGQAQGDLTGGQRLADVQDATWRALQAHKHFTKGGFTVTLGGSQTVGGMIDATVSADYPCAVAGLNAVCLGSSVHTITVTEKFPYQAANVNWED